MSTDYIKVKLGGKERGLKFNMGTLYHLGTLSGEDPLKISQGGTLLEQFNSLKNLIHASLLSNCDSQDKEPDFTEKDVHKWVSQLSSAEAKKISMAFAKAYNDPAAGEGGTDTQ